MACIHNITRLLYCWMCRGQVVTSTPRCRGHCGNIVHACLAVHSDVNTAWNDYLRQSFLRLPACLSEMNLSVDCLDSFCAVVILQNYVELLENDNNITCYYAVSCVCFVVRTVLLPPPIVCLSVCLSVC